jgi:hypothetical protein
MIAMPDALSPIRHEIFLGFLALIFLVTFILPAINLFIFKIFGTIQSLTMEERKDRVVPFIFITILYGVMTYLFQSNFRIGINESLFKFLLIVDFLVLVSTIITLFYRVSIHSISICGLIGILLPLSKISEESMLLYISIGLIAVAGIVMSARLKLNSHTPREILVGAVMGYSVASFSMLFLF